MGRSTVAIVRCGGGWKSSNELSTAFAARWAPPNLGGSGGECDDDETRGLLVVAVVPKGAITVSIDRPGLR